MRVRLAIVIFCAALPAQPISAQAPQANAMILAQAHDRCMTTYAVRLTKAAANDEAIFAEASAGCKELQDQLAAAVAREYEPSEATKLIDMLDAQAKPNFEKLLQRIRTDRAAKPAE